MKRLPEYVGCSDRIILFDGVCVLCTGWARFLLRFDKQGVFKLASVQSDRGQELLRYAELPTDVYETLVFIDGGEVKLRSQAVIAILSRLGLPWSIAKVFLIIPPVLRDALYHRIAINRYCLFGKRSRCFIPDAQQRQRFL